MKAWFVSDLHLKHFNERNGNILLRFLHSIESGERAATHLFLLGDIFDLWIGPSEFYLQQFGPIVESLKKIRERGVEIFYFEGNHDMHIEKFWEEHGVQVEVNELHVQLGPWRVRCEHGDLINQEEIAYQRLRKTLRHPISKMILTSIPASGLHWLGETAAKISRQRSQVMRTNNEENLRSLIRAHASQVVHERPFDFIITGHMHVRDFYKFDYHFTSLSDSKSESKPETATSINLGSWFEKPAVLLLDEQGARFEELGS